MLEPLAEDELGLLVLDVGLGELLLRDLEGEGREVAAAEVGRDVGGREGDVAVLELHCLSIYLRAASSLRAHCRLDGCAVGRAVHIGELGL